MKKYIVAMAILGLIEIGLALYLTEWRHVFWDSIAAKNSNVFLNQLGIFTAVALILCFVSAYSSYCGTLASIKWREKLNSKVFCLEGQCEVENYKQRVQEDCKEYPILVVLLGFGIIKNLVYFIVFSITLVYLFNYYYLIIIVTYAITSTLMAKSIAKPLIKLNYESQRAEATYRETLTGFDFSACVKFMSNIASKTKRLNYFQTFYSQLGVIIPLCVVGSNYFAGLITIGALMQATSIMSTVLESLSYGINSFGEFNRLLSCKKRLKEIKVIK